MLDGAKTLLGGDSEILGRDVVLEIDEGMGMRRGRLRRGGRRAIQAAGDREAARSTGLPRRIA